MQPADSDPSLGSVFAIRTPTLQFALLGLLGFLFFFIATSLGLEQTPRDGSVGVPAASYILAVIILGWMVQRNYPHSTIGICNAVTLIRLTIVAILFTAVIAEPPPSMSMVALAVFALCLDGIDGWFARKQGLASEFGARFDVEVDAAFALLLSVYAFRVDAAGLVILALGLPHYLFWIARLSLPWLNAELPERFSRKAICVLQIGTLVAVIVPGIDGTIASALVTTAVVGLIYSFAIDVRWLYRNRV